MRYRLFQIFSILKGFLGFLNLSFIYQTHVLGNRRSSWLISYKFYGFRDSVKDGMGMGRDCQSQRFLLLGLESQCSKSRDCPRPEKPSDLCLMGRLWNSQNSWDCLGLENPMKLESQVVPKLGIWLSKNFCPGTVLAIFVPVPSVSRICVPWDSKSQYLCPGTQSPMQSQYHCRFLKMTRLKLIYTRR